MEDNKKIILPTSRFAKSESEDLNLRTSLENNETLMREGDRNIVLDINELYNDERISSDKYKIHGKLRVIFNNNFLGTTTYPPIIEKLYKTTFNTGYLPYNEFAFIRDDIHKEKNNIISTTDLDDYEIDIESVGSNNHKNISPVMSSKFNWNCFLTYVKSENEDIQIKYTYNINGDTLTYAAKDGIPFKVKDLGTYFELKSPVMHGINVGEYLIIDTIPYLVDFFGNETFGSENFIINFYKSQFETINLLNDDDVILGKRCIDPENIFETTSRYYVNIHEVLTNTSGYNIDKLGFESSIWKDEKKIDEETKSIVTKNKMETIYFDFIETISLKNLKNNFKISPTEIYVTVVNKNSNGYFNYPPKFGFTFNLHDNWNDEQFQNSNEPYLTSTVENINTIDFNVGDEIQIGDNLLGDFVEYNEYEIKERTISNILHKLTIDTTIFNYGQETGKGSIDNPSGIIYQPHYKIKLRQLSPYIETSSLNNITNLPENVKYFEKDGLWKWRDLYDHGFIDSDGFGTDFPFTNGTHYIKKEINFTIKDERNGYGKKDGITDFNLIKIDC